MSANEPEALFILDDEDKDFEEDPTMRQVRANLVTAERVQQQRAEQRRLERVQCQVEKLQREVEEVRGCKRSWRRQR